MEQIYFVAVQMSSPNRVLNSELKNEGMTLETNFKFKPDTRKKIAALRTLHKKPIFNECLRFYEAIYLCKESQRPKIEQAIQTAEQELKAIETTLSARVRFMKLDMNDVSTGETYQEVVSAIEARILKDISDKIEKVAKDSHGGLTDRSKEALLKMIERLKSINILNDQNIETKLQEIKKRIIDNDIEKIKVEFNKDLEVLKDRGAFLEWE